MRLLVATRSTGKMKEIRRILGTVPGLQVVGPEDVGIAPDRAEDDLEPFDTFEENALSKARWFAERSGLPTVADDSGIEVDALGGAPGVRSKRFAADRGGVGVERRGLPVDDANNRTLVACLADVPLEKRSARYVCVAALVEPGRAPLVVRGTAPGLIIDEPRGGGGFGYDPHMLDTQLEKTFAEMHPSEKDARSHRGKAFRALASALSERLGRGDPPTPGGAAS
jgi:XTP/dITP diphosphohydrolase